MVVIFGSLMSQPVSPSGPQAVRQAIKVSINVSIKVTESAHENKYILRFSIKRVFLNQFCYVDYTYLLIIL